VKDAKPLIKDHLIATGKAVVYSEPTDVVMSRSGDECVVALTDQWFLDYGEEKWRTIVEGHLKNMDFYSADCQNKFEIALGWLNQWACSRTYGLGTKLPWDEQYLIESLSDSTIYMAFYTVSHLLQGGVIDGSQVGPSGIKPELLTRKVWDHIFLNAPYPSDCQIPEETLKTLKKEFNYWYPVDIRVSGKDLINNHLVFALYNHVAMWPDQPDKWPRTMRTNGHTLLNGEKMSKSTGNFMTLYDAIERFSADGMRFALADAGDSLEDANFTDKTADSAILRLYAQLQWLEETLAAVGSLKEGPADSFMDRVFASSMAKSIKETDFHYERTNFREALRTGFFDMQSHRDNYRASVKQMNKDLILQFIEYQAIIMAPIIPHFSEYVWRVLLKKVRKRKFISNLMKSLEWIR
jgi:leucyl-tRNA synthetase